MQSANGVPEIPGFPAGFAQHLQALENGGAQLGGLALPAGTNPAEWLAVQAAASQLLGGDGRMAFGAYGMPGGGSGEDDSYAENSSQRGNKRSKKESSQADYAMRHQAAEQRRRARINERLEALKKLVPHDPRANTASFLEDVIKHIIMLKDTNERLEQALIATHSGAHSMAAAAAAAARNAQSMGATSSAPTRGANATPSHGGEGLSAATLQQLMTPQVVQTNGATILEMDPNLQQALLALQQQAAGNGIAPDQEALLKLLSGSGMLNGGAPAPAAEDPQQAAAETAAVQAGGTDAAGYQQLLSTMAGAAAAEPAGEDS